eukprot:CFRG1922T1
MDDTNMSAPSSVWDTLDHVHRFFAVYGWYLVIAFVAFVYFKDIVADKLSEAKMVRLKKHDESPEDSSIRERMMRVRRKQQEEHSAKARTAAEERKKHEEEKRLRKIDLYDQTVGNSTDGFALGDEKHRPKPKPKAISTTLNPTRDYLPLGGGTTGGGFRSSRRNMKRG